MALNQIHYGPISGSRMSNEFISERERKHIVGIGARKVYVNRMEQTETDAVSLDEHRRIVKEFIFGFKHLVEPSVLRDALMMDNDKDMSLALGQLHHKTLPTPYSPQFQKSFKEALFSN